MRGSIKINKKFFVNVTELKETYRTAIRAQLAEGILQLS
jgi:hypothetical protein